MITETSGLCEAFWKGFRRAFKVGLIHRDYILPFVSLLAVAHWHMLCRIAAHNSPHSTQILWSFLGEEQIHQAPGTARPFFFFSRSLTCCRPRVCDEFPLLEIKQWLQLARNQIHTVWLDYTLHLDDADFILSSKSVLYSNVTKYIRNIINKNFKIGVTK